VVLDVPGGLMKLTVEQCEQIFHAALKAGDARGVEAALLVMAPQDPERAQVLLDSVRVGLAIAQRMYRDGG
jgi:hypothetical protein